ncbi:hypothetical protein FOB72_27175 [Cupriavidus pauculus]|uniref:Uncharacterized protein n=1 Tax=Cupriavidus pauculus TaxID=82633 RepID=A0A5P2HF52_9BURK|nr:hypothetical protein [Cupriavidus pauculus]QET05670.1 hypothetical protein FOB72_27175 [Cupriavidus pauculus]
MNEARQISAPCVPQRVEDGVCRLRAVVATYRSALQAFTLAVSPAELMRLCGKAEPGQPDSCLHSRLDPQRDPQLLRLRDSVMACGLALPSAIVVAVAGGRMQCESDHLYTLDLRPDAGDALIVLEGQDRLEQLARGERGDCKTLVTAVLCHTVIDGAMSPTMASLASLTSITSPAAYQTSSTSRSKWPARM